MLPIRLLFPDATRLLAFRPEDLAPIFVEYFKLLPTQDRWMAKRCAMHWAVGYPADQRAAVARRLLDVWCWLHAHGDVGVASTRPTGSADRPAAGDHATSGHAA